MLCHHLEKCTVGGLPHSVGSFSLISLPEPNDMSKMITEYVQRLSVPMVANRMTNDLSHTLTGNVISLSLLLCLLYTS